MKKADTVLQLLDKEYPFAVCELDHNSPYELLVAVILSAQCKDERVNKITAELFKEYNTPEKMITLSQEELEKYIFSCGCYRIKAKNILAMSRVLLDEYGGVVPNDLKKLQQLAGVGRKTANVVGAVAFNIPAIAVDTHVFRVANRIGLADAPNELQTELQLQKNIKKDMWIRAHHLIIFHGRRCCSSQKPACHRCTVSAYCKFYKNSLKKKQ